MGAGVASDFSAKYPHASWLAELQKASRGFKVPLSLSLPRNPQDEEMKSLADLLLNGKRESLLRRRNKTGIP